MFAVRETLTALAIASAVFLCGSVEPSRAVSSGVIAFPHKLKIVTFGTSTTFGVGASSQTASYPSRLAVELRKAMPRGSIVEVINSGTDDDADHMIKRLKTDVLDHRPDLVIYEAGGADPLYRADAARFEAETRASIDLMRSAGIKIMLLEPQWCPHLDGVPGSLARRKIVRKIGEEMEVPVIRRADLMHDWVRTGLVSRAAMLSLDGLHMSDQGYALLARWVTSEVLKIEAFRPVPRSADSAKAAL